MNPKNLQSKLNFKICKNTRKGVKNGSYQIYDYIFFVCHTDFDEHQSVIEGLSRPKMDEWLKAMKEELDSMKIEKVWNLVDLPNERCY